MYDPQPWIDLCTALLSGTLIRACELNHIFVCVEKGRGSGTAIIMLKVLGATIQNVGFCMTRHSGFVHPLPVLTTASFHIFFTWVLIIVPFVAL
jgi:hypothetical protein